MDDRESTEDELITRSQHAARIIEINLILLYSMLLIPVAARSEARVCGRQLAEIAGSNPGEGHRYSSLVSVVCCQVQVYLSALCVVRYRSTCQRCVLSGTGLLVSVVCCQVQVSAQGPFSRAD